MTHAPGTRLKSAYDVETLRARCVCDRHTDCWHFRKADGKPFTRGETPKVWLYGGTYATPTRAMWLFHTGKPVQRHLVIYRKCESMDCINPEHLRCGTREVAVRFSTKRAGVSKNSLENLRASRDQRSKLTPELRAWVLESSQSGSEVAHVMGMSQGRINLIRQQARQSLPKAACSIFALGAAMNAPHMRRSA